MNDNLRKFKSLNPISRLQFYINHNYIDADNVDPRTNLLSFLRENGYTGAKYGCGEGGCGACCVVVAQFDQTTNQVSYRTANSCLMPVCAAFGKQILTVEGIGSLANPHPVQERFAFGHASQCGFCTPGFVMSLFGLLKINPEPTFVDIEEAFDGNLCRCTGYRSIIESARSFAKKSCNGTTSNLCNQSNKRLVEYELFKDYDPNNDPLFPAELTKFKSNMPVLIANSSSIWFRPSELDDLLIAKDIWPEARLIGGNSEVGVESASRPLNQQNVFVYIGDLQALREVILNEDSLEIGVNITIAELINSLNELKKNCKLHHKSLFNAFLSNLRWFSSRHIRNFATIGGNIATGSPISDLNPILVATNAVLIVCSKENGERRIQIREFFLAYRKVDLNSNEILSRVSIPMPRSDLEKCYAFKQAKRKSDDIALVNGCFRARLNEAHEIEQLDVALGGVSAKTIYLEKLTQMVRGMKWGNVQTLDLIENSILDQVNIDYSAPGAHPTYRRTLVVSFFTKFWHQIIKDLNITSSIDPKLLLNIEDIERQISSSSQDVFSSGHEPHLGSTSPHVSALLHTTGTATYTDDIPKQSGELYAWPVMSTKAHALILSVDESKALALKGVYAFISHKDVPKSNVWGLAADEEYFASKRVLFHGQLIGLVIAENASLAKLGANLVDVKYEELKSIITIDDAMEVNSFHSDFETKMSGLIDENTFKNESTDLVHEGIFEIGGQEHFYLETISCLIIPKRESDELEIHSTTQNTAEIQENASNVLGIPKTRVRSLSKRIGGGFGGKETRPSLVVIPCVVAANKLKRPIRCMLERTADMIMSGKRHPFKAFYKIRVSRDGMFKAYDLLLVNNGGHSLDLSASVLHRAICNCDNVYNFPNIRISGRVAKTNVASNTAFRGFGTPQAVSITEFVITEVAEKLNMDQVKIRKQNMYKENDFCLSGEILKDWYVPEMFQTVVDEVNYELKRKEIDKFNEENAWKKRGLAVMPTRYGLGFYFRPYNQGAAQVNIYTDGSVLIHTCGIEMGQGLHTKLIHIAANALQIPESQIYIRETSTDTVPNGVPTAASVSTDLIGASVLQACETLNERIASYRAKNPTACLSEWAKAAFLDRVSLSACGFYKRENNDEKTTNLHAYSSHGVALSIVELDVLTGDHIVLRSDVFMDVGKSINYGIDVGQVEGAFVQGLGLFTIEDLMHVQNSGALATKGPGTYKIPTARDIPQQFNVRFLKDKEYRNLENLKKSKGVGEPPLQLAFSVFLALRDAVNYARKSIGLETVSYEFNSPATCESLRLACRDHIVINAEVVPKKGQNLFYVRP